MGRPEAAVGRFESGSRSHALARRRQREATAEGNVGAGVTR